MPLSLWTVMQGDKASILAEMLGFQQSFNGWISDLLLSTLTISLFFLLVLHQKNKPTPKLPPSPWSLPLLGNLHQLGPLPHRSLRSLASRHGPLMLLRFGSVPTLIVSSAELAREVFKARDHAFSGRPSLSVANKLLYDSHDVVFAPYGEHWRQAKKACVLHLLNPRTVQSFASVRQEEVSLLVNKIRRSSSLGSVDLTEMTFVLINEIAARVVLGRKYSGDFRGLIAEIAVLFGSFPFKDFIPRLGWVDALSGMDARVRKTFERMDSFLESVLDEHLEAKRSGRSGNGGKEWRSFVDSLLSAGSHDDTLDSFSLTRDSIKALITDMFIGGTETTAATLEWTMAELIKNPGSMKRLQEEVRGVVGRKEIIVEEDLERMTYMKAVIKESLRLHPVAALLVPRETIKDTQLQGYHIPAGTRVMINAWAIGRDPRSLERPEEFWPERFLNDNVDFRGQEFEIITFGGGRRLCPGIGFAKAAIELTLANLLHHFDWELPDGMKEEAFDMSDSPGFTAHRKLSLVLAAKPRLS